ncbi:glycosyltransferase [Frigoribacterium sp. 2-23]|uniref:glycosyltransferase n=1 Tax=Frigoribacterium sp. 2-23 TaxID=3415006 RepID=UPI003C6EBC7A
MTHPTAGAGGVADAVGVALPGNRWDLLDGIEPAVPPLVSVIVAHYRQQRQLDRTLAALHRQDHPADRLEIVVVDDGSPERPVVPADVRLVVQEDLGFRLAAARNAGAAVATGDVLCFLDADTAPEPSYVRRLTRLPALAPDVVTVGRRRHASFDDASAPAPASQPEPVEVAGPRTELGEPGWLRDAYARSRDLLDSDDRSYRYLIGAVTACSRRLFDETGGYAESFTRYGGEDWEWAYRAWLAGALFAHVPGAVAWHDGPEWSGRPAADDRRAKNEEALLLAELIPVPGSRGRAARGRYADVALRPPADPASTAQSFVSVDSILVEVPEARVASPAPGTPADDAAFDRVRIEIVLHEPVRSSAGEIRAAVDRVATEQLGAVTLTDDRGTALVTVRSTRATRRMTRWADESLFASVATRASGLSRVDAEPDVEGYLGGWS